MSENAPSITTWLERLRHSDAEAAQRLWERFFERMAAVARQRLRNGRGRAADEEDAALSAFADFTRAIKAGQFPDLRDREGLWAVLIAFTERKARGQIRREQAARRGGGRSPAELPADLADDDENAAPLPPKAAAELRHNLATVW